MNKAAFSIDSFAALVGHTVEGFLFRYARCSLIKTIHDGVISLCCRASSESPASATSAHVFHSTILIPPVYLFNDAEVQLPTCFILSLSKSFRGALKAAMSCLRSKAKHFSPDLRR